jgi:hypothetical protein
MGLYGREKIFMRRDNWAMNREQLAAELVKVAKSLTASQVRAITDIEDIHGLQKFNIKRNTLLDVVDEVGPYYTVIPVGMKPWMVKMEFGRYPSVHRSKVEVVAGRAAKTADMDDPVAVPVSDPIDIEAQYTADIGKELLRLRSAYGLQGIRQNYRGTGRQRARRQLYIRLENGALVDVWLNSSDYEIGGVTLIRIRGTFPYGGRPPATIAREIAEKLKTLVRTANAKTATTTIMNRLNNAEALIKGGGRGMELGIREIEYLAHDIGELAKHLRVIQRSGEMGYSGEMMTQESLLATLADRVGR